MDGATLKVCRRIPVAVVKLERGRRFFDGIVNHLWAEFGHFFAVIDGGAVIFQNL